MLLHELSRCGIYSNNWCNLCYRNPLASVSRDASLRARISWPPRWAEVAAQWGVLPEQKAAPSSHRHLFLMQFCLFGLCPFHSLSLLCLLWSTWKMVRRKGVIQVPLECPSAAVINSQVSQAVDVTSGHAEVSLWTTTKDRQSRPCEIICEQEVSVDTPVVIDVQKCWAL